MVKEEISSNVIATFPLVFFISDGYYAEVKRDVIIEEGKKRRLVVIPEPAVYERYEDLKNEADEGDGTITLDFNPEEVIDSNRDPNSPRLVVLTDIKGKIKSTIHKALLHIIHTRNKEIQHLKVAMLNQAREMKEILEDIEGSIERYERIRTKMRVPANPIYDNQQIPGGGTYE